MISINQRKYKYHIDYRYNRDETIKTMCFFSYAHLVVSSLEHQKLGGFPEGHSLSVLDGMVSDQQTITPTNQ